MNVSPVLPGERERVRALEEVGVPVRVAVRPENPFEEVARAVSAEPRVLGAALTQPERALEMRVFWTRLRRVTLDAVEELRPDVVLIGHDMSMAWSDDLPADLPAVLTCHNLLWNWYESRARLSDAPDRRPAASRGVALPPLRGVPAPALSHRGGGLDQRARRACRDGRSPCRADSYGGRHRSPAAATGVGRAPSCAVHRHDELPAQPRRRRLARGSGLADRAGGTGGCPAGHRRQGSGFNPRGARRP